MKTSRAFLFRGPLLIACAVFGAAIARTDSSHSRYNSDNPLFNYGDVDVKPKPTFQVPPNFPHELRGGKMPVKVTVEYVVNTVGATQDVLVTESEDPRFNDPTIAAVKRWKFTIPRKKGRPVNCRTQQELTFNLTED